MEDERVFNITQEDVLKGWGFNPTAIALIPKMTGTLSLLGSCYVVQDVLRSPIKRTRSTFHRVMLGLSVLNIISSLFVGVISTWAMPKGYFVFAVGSVASCDAVGFFHLLTIFATPIYICSLATYYLVQLKYNWRTEQIKKIEKWFHIAPWSVGIIAAVAGMVTKSYGPRLFSCG